MVGFGIGKAVAMLEGRDLLGVGTGGGAPEHFSITPGGTCTDTITYRVTPATESAAEGSVEPPT
jgi:hypothetical protein